MIFKIKTIHEIFKNERTNNANLCLYYIIYIIGRLN